MKKLLNMNQKNKKRENVNMKDLKIHSKMFQYRVALFVIAIPLIVANFMYPNNIYIHLSLPLLLAFMLVSYAVERFREKKWLPFSAYTLIILLNIFQVSQELYRQLYIYK